MEKNLENGDYIVLGDKYDDGIVLPQDNISRITIPSITNNSEEITYYNIARGYGESDIMQLTAGIGTNNEYKPQFFYEPLQDFLKEGKIKKWIKPKLDFAQGVMSGIAFGITQLAIAKSRFNKCREDIIDIIAIITILECGRKAQSQWVEDVIDYMKKESCSKEWAEYALRFKYVEYLFRELMFEFTKNWIEKYLKGLGVSAEIIIPIESVFDEIFSEAEIDSWKSMVLAAPYFSDTSSRMV